jgi:hypothetical protein
MHTALLTAETVQDLAAVSDSPAEAYLDAVELGKRPEF